MSGSISSAPAKKNLTQNSGSARMTKSKSCTEDTWISSFIKLWLLKLSRGFQWMLRPPSACIYGTFPTIHFSNELACPSESKVIIRVPFPLNWWYEVTSKTLGSQSWKGIEKWAGRHISFRFRPFLGCKENSCDESTHPPGAEQTSATDFLEDTTGLETSTTSDFQQHVGKLSRQQISRPFQVY